MRPPTASSDGGESRRRRKISERPRDAASRLVHLVNVRVVLRVEGLARESRDLVDAVPAGDLEPLLVESFIVFSRTFGDQ